MSCFGSCRGKEPIDSQTEALCQNEDGVTVALSQWMTNLPEQVTKIPINQLAIPGSHDSGAYYLDPNTPVSPDESTFIQKVGRIDKQMIIRWSITQSLPISQQLAYGIRYFDMRPGYLASKNDFLFVHGIYGHPIVDLLNEINSFLKANPREVVIIDFNHFYSFTDALHHRFINSILSIFVGMILTKNDNNGSGVKSSLSDFWSLNKQVFIRYTSDISEQHIELWPTSVITSPWFNTDSTSTLISALNKNFSHLDDKKLNIFQAILSPQNSTLLLHLCSSLRDALIKKCNVAVKQWLADIYSQRKKGVNIVICDYASADLCAPPVILLNDIHTAEIRANLFTQK